MASIKACFVVGLLVIGFSLTILGVGLTQDIPDDVVYTDVTKTLITNNTGLLTCRFKGTPLAVYWKKGSDPGNAPLVASLHYGDSDKPEKGGPRYDDGSCDIDENYSLVIKRARMGDAGRYICMVASYKGNLIHNFTDVTITDAAVKTRSVVALQKGRPGVLPCELIILPKKISWLRSPSEILITMELSGNAFERSGPGYDKGLYSITEECSLVIKDVMVMHEDRYFCEVTDHDTGKLFRNVTELSIFASPLEPFPSIKECPQEQENLPSCTLRITSRTMLTCQVEGYYPHIDLFFVHGAERVDLFETREWKNTDGTKNKRITVSFDDTSDTLFECVAAGLVGQEDSSSMTIHLIRDVRRSQVAVAVVVPVVFVSALIVVVVLVFKRRKTPSKRKEYERVPIEPMVFKPTQEDLISYIEIWMLVKYVVQHKAGKNLATVVDVILGDEAGSHGSGTAQTEEDYYKEICKWKKGYHGTSQRDDLFEACRNQGLKAALDQSKEYSESQREVTSDDLEHTLWHIGEGERIIQLLKELGASPAQTDRLQNKSIKDVIVGAINVLKYWRDVNSTGNQEVMLSLALEKLNYSPHDEDFFRIPEEQKRGLDKQEIHSLLPEVTSRHCRVLVDATMELKMNLFGPLERKDVWLDDIIKKNRTELFDSHQMIEDWWAEQNCSNYEKRCRLRIAAEAADQDQNILTEPGEDHKDIYQESSDGKLNYGPLSRPKGVFIYKTELVDMALDLIIEDFRPYARALGIKGTRLTSYKREFHPSHLMLGTISLLLRLGTVYDDLSLLMMSRSAFCNILSKAGYQKVTSRFMSACEPSFRKFELEEALNLDDKLKVDKKGSNNLAGDKEQSPPVEATQGDKPMVDVGSNLSTGVIKPNEQSDKNLATCNEQSLFRATKESQSDRKTEILHGNVQGTPRSEGTLTVVDGEETQTTSVLGNSGQYHDVKLTEFIVDMLKEMDGDRITTLTHLLKIKKRRRRLLGGMPQAVFAWVGDWTKQMETTRYRLLMTARAEWHRDFNDELVDRGYLDLAREIMNIELYQ